MNNTLVWPGVPVGSELTGLMAYTNADVGGGYGLDFYRYGILNDTSFVSTDITYKDVQIAEKIDSYGGISDAFSPNLSAFHTHGGKILHYHGGQDSIVNTGVSPIYYDNVLSFFASLDGQNQIEVPDFYRLFMVPGLGHCDGGDGAWVIGATGTFLPTAKNDTAHSALLALIAWREEGMAPEALVGTKYANETVVDDTPVDLTIDFTRPSCLWPSIPEYRGGDMSQASSWKCPNPLL